MVGRGAGGGEGAKAGGREGGRAGGRKSHEQWVNPFPIDCKNDTTQITARLSPKARAKLSRILDCN